MPVEHRFPSRVLLWVLAAVALSCGGDSPTTPDSASPQNPTAGPALNLDLDVLTEDPDDGEAPDVGAFGQVLARLGHASGSAHVEELSSLSDPTDWAITVTRAPKTGTKFKVTKDGVKPNPAPKFRFKVTAPLSLPNSVLLVLFETAGGKQCGAGIPSRDFDLSPNVARTVDIPNDRIIVGPNVCDVDGLNCSRTACKFPLTTTKMRILFGNDQEARQGITNVKYTWTTPSGGGGGGGGGGNDPNQPPPPNPTPTPDPGNGGGGGGGNCPAGSTPGSAPCGTPTAKCDDGTYSCSQNASGTCSSHGGVDCWICPGPLCH